MNIFDLYDSALHFVDFVVSRTSDSLAEIMIKALPLLAPLPNAISIYYIVQHDPLKYNGVQAFAAAAALECMFFALTEVTLIMWDGAQSDRRYWWPLGIIGGAFAAYFALVLWLVYALESAHGNYAPMAFPFVSLVAAVALGCFRWHKRNHAQSTRRVKTAQSKPVIVQDAPTDQHEDAQSEIEQDAQPAPDEAHRARLLKSEGLNNIQIAAELGVHRNTVGALLKRTNGHKEVA